jgi:hypothetical protein
MVVLLLLTTNCGDHFGVLCISEEYHMIILIQVTSYCWGCLRITVEGSTIFFLFHDSTALVDLGILIIEASQSH